MSISSSTVYTQDDTRRLPAAARDLIRKFDVGLPVFNLTNLTNTGEQVQYGKAIFPARLGVMFVGAFGVLGLVLAAVRVYGVR